MGVQNLRSKIGVSTHFGMDFVSLKEFCMMMEEQGFDTSEVYIAVKPTFTPRGMKGKVIPDAVIQLKLPEINMETGEETKEECWKVQDLGLWLITYKIWKQKAGIE